MTTNCCFTHLSLGDEEILKGIVNDFSEFNKIRPMDIGEIKMDNLADELVDIDIDVVKDYFTEEAWNAIKQSGIVNSNQLNIHLKMNVMSMFCVLFINWLSICCVDLKFL